MMKNCFLPITVLLILMMGTDAKGDSFSAINERARKGDVEAQYQLGVIYEKGEDQEQNFYKAVRWYRKAAKQGHAKAQAHLGELLTTGQGVGEVNYVEAVKWMHMAADQGQGMAQLFLATIYSEGAGLSIPKDYVKGYMWLNIANASGENIDNREITNLKKKMTAAQIAKSERNIKSWLANHKSKL
tara:strand:+ start:227 stop:784 length:558 start_codon:yes stop_codon:yes gene_type:complete